MRKNLFLVCGVVCLSAATILMVWIIGVPDAPPEITSTPLPPPSGFRAEMLSDTLSTEARIFIRTCTQCHDLPNPKMHAAAEWPAIAYRMIDRLIRRKTFSAGTKSLYVPIEKDYARMVDYLKKYAFQAAPEKLIQENTPQARLFRERCTQCHALPHPSEHTASEWPKVVERMRENMEKFKRVPLTDSEAQQIVAFLSARRR